MSRPYPKPPGPFRTPRSLRRHRAPAALALLAIGVSGALGTVTGCASLLGPQTNLTAIAQSAVPGRGNVFATLEPDGTAVVSGWVEDRIGQMAVLRAVGNEPQVVRVVDRLNPFDYF